MNTDLSSLSGLARLTEISRYDLAAPELRTALDDVARRTAARLGQPISLVTVVLDTAELVVGSHGPLGWIAETGGAPAEWAFCAQLVRDGRPYVVPDLAADPVQHDNPVVFRDGARSYAGIPLVSANGHVLGGHCVVGVEPRRYGEADLEVLRRGGEEALALLRRYRDGTAEAG
ncbi:GAF domain-containing protein [Planomonospora sp. ID82291]|uniref:GAF domain-containing protein n=1 Tax=Planomonospora sp. ID82291 TaxID=2738136 RepID=UPI0018C3FE9A|nr:GAF domain-containing protein [Planomonospora sp. ID82291]MBG0818591.1 GAF domain-containing protein [Planomonospora sp. ID82291]